MPYRICRMFEIENGHMLSKHPEKCRFPHGHTRRVEIVLESDDLDANDMVCDFKVLRKVIEDYLKSLDHSLCMNTEDPAYALFRERYGERIVGYVGEDPTTEVMARCIHQVLQSRLAEYVRENPALYPLRRTVRIVRVRLWETSSSWAEYAEPTASVGEPPG